MKPSNLSLNISRVLTLPLLVGGIAVGTAHAEESESNGQLTGEAHLELRHFLEEGDIVTEQNQASVVGQLEYYHDWQNGHTLTATPFLRVDSMDSERTHFDLREFYWNWIGDNWDLKVGLKRVFWGVAESAHVIDIINQTDFVENPDGEDKLGQPMIALSRVYDWGILDMYVLTGFRERTFPGVDGRLRPLLPILQDQAVYESSAGTSRTDFAIRWSHTFGDWDVGVAHFSGTSREPEFIANFSVDGGSLTPLYPVIDQTSLDLQATIDAWLLKFEGYTRSGYRTRYGHFVTGFEYAFYGIAGTAADLGVIVEYQFDERADYGSAEGFTDTQVLGFRFALNDTQSTELLVGFVNNVDNEAQSYFVEASRRINENFSVSFEARGITGISDDDTGAGFFYSVRRDNYVQAALEYYF